jgi:hypothetical protein
MFARHKVTQCIGVELDGNIAAMAQRNASALRGRQSEITIVNADAASLDYDRGTVFWLYNPFGKATMETVLTRIQAGVRRRPRQVRFCYVTPEEDDVFAACRWLNRYKSIKPLLHPNGFASFWRSSAV